MGQLQGNPQLPEEKGIENKLFFFLLFLLRVLVLERNAVRESRIVAGWHKSFGPRRENIKSREEEFQLMLCAQLAALLGLWQCW